MSNDTEKIFQIPYFACPWRLSQDILDEKDQVGLDLFFCSHKYSKTLKCRQSYCPLLNLAHLKMFLKGIIGYDVRMQSCEKEDIPIIRAFQREFKAYLKVKERMKL